MSNGSIWQRDISGCLKIFLIAVSICVIGAGLWFGSSWFEKQNWESKYNTLQSQKDSLQIQVANWQSKYNSLDKDYNALEEATKHLEEDYQALQTQNQELEDQRDSLQNSYNALQTQNQELEDQRDSLQNSYDALIEWYSDIRQTVNLRRGGGDDKMLFVTPDDAAVAAKVQEVTGGFSENVDEQREDLEGMYDWVVDNIEYSYDSPLPLLPYFDGELQWQHEYWRMPKETIQDKTGDCEDMAVLLASMIINYTSSEGHPCWVIMWKSVISGHAAVAFPVEGGRLTILDPAGNYYTNKPYSLDSQGASAAVDDWLEQWPGEPGIYVSGVFSDTVYETFATTDEFVEWVLAQYQ